MPFKVTAPPTPPGGRQSFVWHWDSQKYEMAPNEVRYFEDRDAGPARQASAIYKDMKVQQIRQAIPGPASSPQLEFNGVVYETVAALTEAIRASVSQGAQGTQEAAPTVAVPEISVKASKEPTK